MPNTEDLIDQLTEELTRRPSVSPSVGRAVLGAVTLITIAVVVGVFGMRADLAQGHPHPVALISALVVLSAGAAVAAALTAMARPAVGAVRAGWQWAVAALAVLPIAAFLTALGSRAEFQAMLPPEGPSCLILGTLSSLAAIIVLTLWLRRGAPTSPERAAWLIGVAGGAVGALAVAFICPIDAITHIGTWHMGIIAVAALGSRLVLPRFLRW
jgi:hypothetical protein